MKVVAALAWYQEPIEFLDRLVRSLAGVVDELVALDGRWSLFDDGAEDAFLSDPDQTETIVAAAAAVALPLSFGIVDGVWPSQVAKRDALMKLAATRGDWILVVDGDEYVEACDRGELDAGLAAAEVHVASVMTVPKTREAHQLRRPEPVRRIYRSTPALEVAVAHNGYRDATGWLHGDPAYVRLVPPANLSAHLRMAHQGRARGDARNDLATTYRMKRRAERVEAWRR